MKTTTGACKYCGQIMTLKVPESFTQEDIDQEVEKKCSCPEAKAFWKIEENIACTESTIRDFFEDKDGMDAIRNLLLGATRPLAEGKIGKLIITKGKYTASMKLTKDKIKVSLKYTTVESVES